MVKLGAHQSINGGYHQALIRINNIGGNCLQIFSTSPRNWSLAKIVKEEEKKFFELKDKLKIEPVYFHASYLINLADEGKIGHLSKQLLIAELTLAAKLDIKGSIIHLGSYKNFQFSNSNFQSNSKYRVLIKNIKEVLENTPKQSLFIIENSGTKKIGQTLEEIKQIIKDVDDKRVRLCFDTCHLFSNGHKFENQNELDQFLARLKKLSLFEKLEVFHLNDSRDEFNSGKDRHENIGQGKIGLNEFKILLNHQQTKNYPFIIETPGFNNEGPDKKNLDILKSLID
ncbi:MAG: deoxyribonuclease IV [Patescibacteria group bacterium]|nr:deoxyribonuclease IV [Patescibacteria group bacterium]